MFIFIFLWGLILLLRILIIKLQRSKKVSFYFFLLQEISSLAIFTFFLAAPVPLLIFFLVLFKRGIPPFHKWMKRMFKRGNKFFVVFLSIYKIPILPFLFFFRERRGILLLISLFTILFVKKILLLLIYSSGVFLFLFILFPVFIFILVILYLFQFLEFYWERRKIFSYIIYFLFSLSLPPTFLFFIKIFLITSFNSLFIIFILILFSCRAYSYFNSFLKLSLKDRIFMFLKGRGWRYLSFLVLILFW